MVVLNLDNFKPGSCASKPEVLGDPEDVLRFAMFLKHAIDFKSKPNEVHAAVAEPKFDTREFRTLGAEQPSKFELEEEVPNLRRMQHAYNDKFDFLDMMFRLYREDFVRPLREAIREEGSESGRNVVFRKVTVGELYKTQKHEIAREIFFNFQQKRMQSPDFWNASRKLSFGALLVFGRNSFDTSDLFWGVIVDRDPKRLAEGTLGVNFLGAFIPTSKDEFIVAETPAFFEAYVHTLKSLQKLGELPFEDVWVRGKVESVRSPAYIERIDLFDFSNIYGKDATAVKVCPKNLRLPVAKCILEESQLRAFEAMVFSEVSLTQGPPGTGKSFVATKLVEFFLLNKPNLLKSLGRAADEGLRLLLLGFSNHAIYQLLSSVWDVGVRRICRIGSRSKVQHLKEYELSKMRIKLADHLKREEREGRNALKKAQETLIEIDGGLRSYEFQVLPPLIDDIDWDARFQGHYEKTGHDFRCLIGAEEEDTKEDPDGFEKVRRKRSNQALMKLEVSILLDVKAQIIADGLPNLRSTCPIAQEHWRRLRRFVYMPSMNFDALSSISATL